MKSSKALQDTLYVVNRRSSILLVVLVAVCLDSFGVVLFTCDAARVSHSMFGDPRPADGAALIRLARRSTTPPVTIPPADTPPSLPLIEVRKADEIFTDFTATTDAVDNAEIAAVEQFFLHRTSTSSTPSPTTQQQSVPGSDTEKPQETRTATAAAAIEALPTLLSSSSAASAETLVGSTSVKPETADDQAASCKQPSCSPMGDFAHVIGPATQLGVRLANANNEFAFKLAKTLIKTNPQRNIFFSPLTLFSTLITMYTGAGGDTRAQLRSTLGLHNLTDFDIEHGFRDLLRSFEKDAKGSDQNSLKMLNALFIDKQTKIATAYTDKVRTYFNAYLEKVGFASEPDYVLDWVNKLVAWWTEGHIKTLLDQAPDALTKLLLVNAVFFRGKWATTFEERFTSPEPFTDAAGKRSLVQMMKRTESYQVFCDNTTYHTCALELLYTGGGLSFLVLSPASGYDLSTLDQTLSTQTMYEMISRLEERTLELGLPKFTMTSSYDLQEPLRALGISDAFTPGEANFTRMTNTTASTLFVTEMTHKNVLELSEEGTVAAGAAFASIGNRRKPAKLYVDRPFMFMVRDLKTDAILFLGRVVSLP